VVWLLERQLNRKRRQASMTKKMQYRIDVCPGYSDRSGITLEHNKRAGYVNVSGWYDGCVGIEGKVFDTADLMQQLGFDSVLLRELACVLELRESQAKIAARDKKRKDG
jgi:hypothetical protein